MTDKNLPPADLSGENALTPTLPPELKKAVDWLIEEAMQAGAGLADCPSDATVAADILKALGFTSEDVTLLEQEARDYENGTNATGVGENRPDLARRYRSLASRIANVLPPNDLPTLLPPQT